MNFGANGIQSNTFLQEYKNYLYILYIKNIQNYFIYFKSKIYKNILYALLQE